MGQTGHFAAKLLRYEPSERALVRGGSYGNRAAPSSRGRLGGCIYALSLIAAIAAGCGSGGAEGSRPTAALASSQAAQREFGALQRRWLVGSDADRARLEPELGRFIQRHGSDQRARLARLYLAFILIQRGDLARARAHVELARGPAGSADDFANVASAAILVRDGKPAEALALLDPLDGKIVDAEERMLYGEQRAVAALAARRHAAVVGYALKWLAEAPPEDRDAVGARSMQLLKNVPVETLERGLRELDAESSSGSAPAREGARDWLRKAMREHLVQVALERRDPLLARRLLEEGPASLRAGERGNQLTRLAFSGAVVPRVSGRAIGFVLSLDGAPSRRASAEVIAGISRALGLPERDSDPRAVRLITADASADDGVKTALATLAGDGAAVLIAGVEPKSAEQAREYADSAGIPLIVLSPVAKLDPKGFTFTIAADRTAQDTALGEELTRRGASAPARVGAGGVPCEGDPRAAGQPRFPVQTWRRDRIDALVLLGDAACARDAVSELAHAGATPLLAFGLECAELISELRTAQPRFAVAAGKFPLQGGDKSNNGLQRWRERTGRAPSWAAALGHDAALLASAAISDFALERVDDAREVAALHRRAQKNLAGARAELWTSDKKGFEGGRRLERTLTIASVVKQNVR